MAVELVRAGANPTLRATHAGTVLGDHSALSLSLSNCWLDMTLALLGACMCLLLLLLVHTLLDGAHVCVHLLEWSSSHQAHDCHAPDVHMVLVQKWAECLCC